MAYPVEDVELDITDLSTTNTIFEKLFDWKIKDIAIPQSSFTMIDNSEGPGDVKIKQVKPGALLSMIHFEDSDTLHTVVE